MKVQSRILKFVAIANAVIITTLFVGCPGRKNPPIATIAPPPIETPPPSDAPPFVTIAPYGGNIRHFLPTDKPPEPIVPEAKVGKPVP